MTRDAKKIIRTGSLAVFFIFIFIFGFWGARGLIFGVKITEINIVDGSTASKSVMDVAGNAKNAVNLSLNGREISINQEGDWRETIALLPGYNVVNIRAVDKFGYVDEKNYQLIYAAGNTF